MLRKYLKSNNTNMKKTILLLLIAGMMHSVMHGQLNPAITSWLQNDSLTGSYYSSGNSTAIGNNILVNCQKVEYSTDFVYVTTAGIPAYPTGPFLDGNPSQAEDQDAIFKFPLNPQHNPGTATSTNGGNIGVFIDGVALFDYRDGVAWNTATGALCGGPGNPPCGGGPGSTQAWNRDAIPAEMDGFDCSKGHPAMGNYHHHQNPSAFKLDLDVVSSICNLYDADGLYAIDNTVHSPLIGYAYDGFPIYGAYGYRNTDGTGGITRIKSSYHLRNISNRTHHADGTDVDDGPTVGSTYFLGYFREDYEFIADTSQDYLDEHNGRTCVTPEYPNGTYAYFCTVDANWNSSYPYAVGPTFSGMVEDRLVNSIGETTTVYIEGSDTTTNPPDTTLFIQADFQNVRISVFPNPATDILAIQLSGLNRSVIQVQLVDLLGKEVFTTQINPGQTIASFDLQSLYQGTYFIKMSNGTVTRSEKILIKRP